MTTNHLKCLIGLFLLLICSPVLTAQDDNSFYDKPLRMRFNILDEEKKEVAIAPRKSGDNLKTKYEGQVSIPETVTYNGTTYTVVAIADKTFNAAANLELIEFNESLRTIGDRAFDGCAKLKMESLVLGGKISSIGSEAFNGCTGVGQFVLGKALETIGDGAFARCHGKLTLDKENPYFVYENDMLLTKDKTELLYTYPLITKIEFPKELKVIRPYSLHSLRLISELVIPEGVTTIGDRAIDMADHLKKLSLPATLEHWGESVLTGNYELEVIEVAAGNKHFVIKDHSLYSKDLKQIIKYPIAAQGDATSYTIYEGVEEIMSGCFANAKFAEYKIPTTIKKLGNSAFFNNSALKELQLPHVQSIGEMCFFKCPELTKLYFGPDLKEIGSYCFSFSPKLLLMQIDAPKPPKHPASFLGIFSVEMEREGTLYVPIGSKEAYKNEKSGGDFAAIHNIVETDKNMLPTTQISVLPTFTTAITQDGVTISTPKPTLIRIFDSSSYMRYEDTVDGVIDISLPAGIYFIVADRYVEKVIVL